MRGRRKYEKMNIINVENITKSYTGRKLFSKASFYVQENEKIGIIGINGTGKSTLLKIVAGDEEPDEGTVTTANHIVINYLPQNPEFDPDETALEHVMSRVVTSQLDEDMRWSIESDAKSLLMKLDITDMTQKTGELSGGQRKRLALATVVLKPCDVLILDEPTNHLDIASKEILENALNDYTGTVLYVSHDRYFINQTASRILDLVNHTFVNYIGNYDYYLEKKEELTTAYAGEASTPSSVSDNSTDKNVSESKLSWQEQKEAQARLRKRQNELKKTEERIGELEDRDGEIDALMVQEEIFTNSVKCQELAKEKAAIAEELEELYMKWEELAEDA